MLLMFASMFGSTAFALILALQTQKPAAAFMTHFTDQLMHFLYYYMLMAD